jgi:hypothetical protein
MVLAVTLFLASERGQMGNSSPFSRPKGGGFPRATGDMGYTSDRGGTSRS